MRMRMASLSTAIYSEGPDQSAASREDLIMEHLPQVRWIATRIHEKLPDNTSLEDLISIGIIGLINAIDNFDPALNVKLKTYAEYRIRGAILDSIRGMDGIAPHKRKRLKQVQGGDGYSGAASPACSQRKKKSPLNWESDTRSTRNGCWSCAASASGVWTPRRRKAIRAP